MVEKSKPATDSELGELHSRLAKSMFKALDNSNKATILLEAEREYPLPEDVVMFLEECSENSPSLLAAIAKFLKDNSITCQIEKSEEMTALQQRLAQKKRVGNIIPIDE